MGLKVAVYTIAKNEAGEVAGWLAATADADYRLVVDTGSTDDTDTEFLRAGNVSSLPAADVRHAAVLPWRFDDAFNLALHSLPADIDVAFRVDMDERPEMGWREALEAAWVPGTTKLRYPYHWSPRHLFYGDRIHARAGYRWRGATHEGLVWRGGGEEKIVFTDSLEVRHFSRSDKPRPNDLPLLAETTAEYPNDAALALYHGRELFWRGQFNEATVELRRAMDLRALGQEETAYAARLTAQCVHAGGDAKRNVVAIDHYLGLAEDTFDSPSLQLIAAALAHDRGDWRVCLTRASLSLHMNPHLHWTSEPDIHQRALDYMALAAHNLGDPHQALEYGMRALQLAPSDGRLQANVEHYRRGALLVQVAS